MRPRKKTTSNTTEEVDSEVEELSASVAGLGLGLAAVLIQSQHFFFWKDKQLRM